MITHRIEFRQLAQFVAACQNPSISETARALAITPSALSTGMRALEADLQLGLFDRQRGRLSPLPAGRWLFRQALAVLQAESRLAASLDREAREPRRILVQLDLSFTLGRITSAINRAIVAMADEDPDVLFQPVFLDAGDASPEDATGEPPPATVIAVAYGRTSDGDPPAERLHDDAWLAVGAAGSTAADAAAPLVLLDMRPALVDAIGRHAEAHGFSDRLQRWPGHPCDLASLVGQAPHARFLMPRSMIADRLGLFGLRYDLLEPGLASPLQATVSGPDAGWGHRFLGHVRDALRQEPSAALFRPRVTTRQVHYFNLVQRAGGVSAAARSARVSQPSVSSQLMKMEAALGRCLLERRRDGAGVTAAGKRIIPLTTRLEAHLDTIVRRARDIAAHTQSTIALGTLPSSGHDSAMTARIADALTRVRLVHPDWRLHIVEASNSALHDGVRSGQLNLAIVGAAKPGMTRIALGRSERLSLIANPALGLQGRPEITLAEVCALPLVLGPRELSIHQLFLEAARTRRLPVVPVVEVGSLPLAIAMVRRAPLGTVLPLSSVQQDVSEGRLTATAIAEDVIAGKLSVIFSSERSLSVAERAIVAALATTFGRSA